MEISGKKVVVVGGASGFGRASAELLASRGADVAILDREGTDGPEVAAFEGGGDGLGLDRGRRGVAGCRKCVEEGRVKADVSKGHACLSVDEANSARRRKCGNAAPNHGECSDFRLKGRESVLLGTEKARCRSGAHGTAPEGSEALMMRRGSRSAGEACSAY